MCKRTEVFALFLVLLLSIPLVIDVDGIPERSTDETRKAINHSIVLDDWDNITGDGHSMGNVRWDSSGSLQLDQNSKEKMDEFMDEDLIKDMGSWWLDNQSGVLKRDPYRFIGTDRFETGYGSLLTSDGGAIIYGQAQYQNSSGYFVRHSYIVKLDQNGDLVWERTYNFGGDNLPNSITETSNGDLLMTGYYTPFPYGMQDLMFARLSPLGTEKWNKTLDLNGSEIGKEILPKGTDNFVILGDFGNGSGRGFLMVEIDGSGNVISNTTNIITDSFIVEGGAVNPDGDYLITGYFYNYSITIQGFLIKISSSGEMVWMREFGNSTYQNEQLQDIVVSQSGDIYLIGETDSYASSFPSDIWLIHTDENGVEYWNRTYDLFLDETGMFLIPEDNGGFTIAGTFRNGYQEELFIANFDNAGNLIWNNKVETDSTDEPIGLFSNGSGYVVFGYSGSSRSGDFLMIEMNETGVLYSEPLISEDLLEGVVASSVYQFEIISYISTGSELYVSFSNDGINWMDSEGNMDQWDQAIGSPSRFNFPDGDWNGDAFHYRLRLDLGGFDESQVGSIKLKYRQFASSGVYISPIFERDTPTHWSILNWTADVPVGTNVTYQVRSAGDQPHLMPKNFIGPNGTTEDLYTNGQSISDVHANKEVFQFKLYLDTSRGDLTPDINSISIHYNSIPKLMEGAIDDLSPDITTNVTFSVNYSDQDGDGPVYIYLNVDGVNFTMREDIEGMDPADGVLYMYTASFPMGNHTFYFSAYDGMDLVATEESTFNVSIGPAHTMEITPADHTMTADESIKFNATCTDEDGNIIDERPEWSVSGGGVIQPDGSFEAEKIGTYNVTASMDSVSESISIIIEPGKVVELEIEPRELTITTDDEIEFTATAIDGDGNRFFEEISWHATGGGSIDENGLFDATTPGTYTIYANTTNISAHTSMAITTGAPASISVTGNRTDANIGQKIQFDAEVKDNDGNVIDINVLWSVSGGGLVDLNGLFTAQTQGDFTVTANYNDIEGTFDFTVNGQSSTDDDDDDDDDDTSKEGSMSPLLIAVPIIIIIALILLVILLIARKKKEEPIDEDEPEEDLYSNVPSIDDEGSDDVDSAPLPDDWMQGFSEE